MTEAKYASALGCFFQQTNKEFEAVAKLADQPELIEHLTDKELFDFMKTCKLAPADTKLGFNKGLKELQRRLEARTGCSLP